MPDQQTLKSKPEMSLTLIPPSPITDKITLDIRAAVWNQGRSAEDFEIFIYLDKAEPEYQLYQKKLRLRPCSVEGIRFSWPTQGHPGKHEIVLEVLQGAKRKCLNQKLNIIASEFRSTARIGGAYAGLLHWSEKEGKYWNKDLAKMTDAQWRELVRSMHAIGMDIILIQEIFRNQEYSGKHNIEGDGYKGRAFYPSKLFPERMPIAAEDPLEAIFDEADKLGMHVCPGIGLYAWFDYSPGSLEWHIKVAQEIWERYGHHPSFYAWKVSEEGHGSLTDLSGKPGTREMLVDFFIKFTAHLQRIAPDKPTMMARSTHGMRGAEETYRKLLPHLDILLAFCFHRMPETDMTGEDAAEMLQNLCNEAGSHLWMNMEVFLFEDNEEGNALIPRPIEQVLNDLQRFPNFEKIVCYQYPGLINSPEMSIKPGGSPTVKLYTDYKAYLDKAP